MKTRFTQLIAIAMMGTMFACSAPKVAQVQQADEVDFDNLLAGFHLVSRKKDKGYWDNQGTRQFYSNWHILVKKATKNEKE